MRYPEFLKPEGRIGFIAPSFGPAIEPYCSAFESACQVFDSLGHKAVFGPNLNKTDGVGRSSTAENCGRELADFYVSSENDVLISTGGGELMCEALDFIDFDVLQKAAPKWYIGYSDNTNFTFLSATLLDTAAIYGPCATAFGMRPWHPAIHAAYDLLTGRSLSVHGYDYWEKRETSGCTETTPLLPYNVTEPTRIVTENWDKAPISGRFIGGCMDILDVLSGTRFDRVKDFIEKYKDDGIIWFLESCDLSVFSIRRALWTFKEAGWFKYVKAFLFGRPLCMGQELMGLDQYRAVTDILSDFNVPILMDLDLGHLPPMMPMISGGYGTIRPYRANIQVDFELK